jgi:hypothetical protein
LLPVQLNVKAPWAFREFLIGEAARQNKSLNQLVIDTLTDSYGKAYTQEEALVAHRQAPAPR